MKTFAALIIIQFFFLFFAGNAHAENTVNVKVNSTTGGNYINGQPVENSPSRNSTHIKVSTNGDTTEVNSEEQGEINVRSVNGQTTVETSPGMKVDVKKGNNTTVTESTSSANSSKSAEIKNKKEFKPKTIPPQAVSEFFKELRNLIKNFLQKFGF